MDDTSDAQAADSTETLDPSLAPGKDRVQSNRFASRLTDIAVSIIEGPRSLLPPPSVDDFGWLEPQLYIRFWLRSDRVQESVAIFCDDTVNRNRDFLPPMIRYARWNQGADIYQIRQMRAGQAPAQPTWPELEVRLSYFNNQRSYVSKRLRGLQTLLAQPPFVPAGLHARRQVADVPVDNARGRFHLATNNGTQIMEFTTDAQPPGDPLTDAVFSMRDMLLGIMQPIDRAGWSEAYNRDISSSDRKMRSWYWDGIPFPL